MLGNMWAAGAPGRLLLTGPLSGPDISGPVTPSVTGGRLRYATGVFAFTHGSVTFVEDSNHLPINTTSNSVSHASFRTARGTRPPDHPPFNFGIYYACLMASNTTWFGVHFLPLDESPPYPPVVNQFFAGFNQIVFSLLKPDVRTTPLKVKRSERLQVLNGQLSSHAGVFITVLASGQTAEKALEEANTLFPPRGIPTEAEEPSEETEELEKVDYFPLLDMILQGDGKSTLNRVYGYDEAHTGEPHLRETYDTWYITRNQP